MSDTVSPAGVSAESASTSSPNPTAAKNTDSSRGRGRGRRGGKQRSDAREKFDPQAAKISMEKYFTEWAHTKRANVRVHPTTDFPSRIGNTYFEHVEGYLRHRAVGDEELNDGIHATSALIHFLCASKLLRAHPASSMESVSDLWNLRQIETHGPTALLSVIDNLGKFDDGPDSVRVAHSALHIKRWYLSGLQQLMKHSTAFPEWKTGDDTIPDYVRGLENWNIANCVFPDRDSVDWIRDSGKNYLTELLKRTHNVTVAVDGQQPQQIRMSNPFMEISNDHSIQRMRIIAWINSLTQHNPDWEQLVLAGLATICEIDWLRRPNDRFGDIDGQLPEGVRQLRVSAFLEALGLTIPYYPRDDYTQPGSLHQFSRDVAAAYSIIFDEQMGLFKAVFNIQRQPDNAFGTSAQLVPIPLEQRQTRPRKDYPGRTYLELPNDPHSSVTREVANKSMAATGLLFGFSYKVEWLPTIVGRLNAGGAAIRSQYLGEDKRVYF